LPSLGLRPFAHQKQAGPLQDKGKKRAASPERRPVLNAINLDSSPEVARPVKKLKADPPKWAAPPAARAPVAPAPVVGAVNPQQALAIAQQRLDQSHERLAGMSPSYRAFMSPVDTTRADLEVELVVCQTSDPPNYARLQQINDQIIHEHGRVAQLSGAVNAASVNVAQPHFAPQPSSGDYKPKIFTPTPGGLQQVKDEPHRVGPIAGPSHLPVKVEQKPVIDPKDVDSDDEDGPKKCASSSAPYIAP
jgi:hypothetical protein